MHLVDPFTVEQGFVPASGEDGHGLRYGLVGDHYASLTVCRTVEKPTIWSRGVSATKEASIWRNPLTQSECSNTVCTESRQVDR